MSLLPFTLPCCGPELTTGGRGVAPGAHPSPSHRRQEEPHQAEAAAEAIIGRERLGLQRVHLPERRRGLQVHHVRRAQGYLHPETMTCLPVGRKNKVLGILVGFSRGIHTNTYTRTYTYIYTQTYTHINIYTSSSYLRKVSQFNPIYT